MEIINIERLGGKSQLITVGANAEESDELRSTNVYVNH